MAHMPSVNEIKDFIKSCDTDPFLKGVSLKTFLFGKTYRHFFPDAFSPCPNSSVIETLVDFYLKDRIVPAINPLDYC